MCSDFSLKMSAVRTKNYSLNTPADQHNFMGTDGLELKMPNGWRTKSLVYTNSDFTVDEGKEWRNPSRAKN